MWSNWNLNDSAARKKATKNWKVSICWDPSFFVGSLHPYYSRAGEALILLYESCLLNSRRYFKDDIEFWLSKSSYLSFFSYFQICQLLSLLSYKNVPPKLCDLVFRRSREYFSELHHIKLYRFIKLDWNLNDSAARKKATTTQILPICRDP